MPIPTGGSTDRLPEIAQQIAQQLNRLMTDLAAWRSTVDALSQTDSERVQAIYQQLAATRKLINAKKNIPGIGGAYADLFDELVTFDPATAFPPALAEMDSLVNWLQANYPEKTATGKPAFQEFSAAAGGELAKFAIPLSPGARTAILARIDALLAHFTYT